MQRNEFNDLFYDIDAIKASDIAALNGLRIKYPYFQNLHLLLAKAYNEYQNGSEELKSALNRAAIYSVDRAYLKQILAKDHQFVEIIHSKPVQPTEPISTPETTIPQAVEMIPQAPSPYVSEAENYSVDPNHFNCLWNSCLWC